MTPRHIRHKRQILNGALKVLERDVPKFAAAQNLIHERKSKLTDSSPLGDYPPGSAERLKQVLAFLEISAEAYLDLVTDMDSQKAYTTVLLELGRQHWAVFVNIESHFLIGQCPHEIEASINHWINEGYRRLASHAEQSEPESVTEDAAEFPNRAAWLTLKLRERGWDHNDPWRHSGPDRKTIDKILSGKRVREDVLEKLSIALSSKRGKVELLEIPNS